MSGQLMALVIAAAAGITMALQGSLNSALGRITGLWEATFVVHLTGLIFVSLMLFVLGVGKGHLGALFSAPPYVYLGGVLGVLIVYGVVKSIPKVGVAPATTAIVVGQVLTASLVDHFGLFGLNKVPFAWSRILGVALLAGGAWFLLRRDG